MKPVLEIPELIAWATLILFTCGAALPVFVGRVIYVMARKDTMNK